MHWSRTQESEVGRVIGPVVMSDDDVGKFMSQIDPLELEDRTQPFIDGALQTRRQRAAVFNQETAVEGQELGDIHDRIAGEARRARRQQDIPWGVGEFYVAGDRGYDGGLNPAEIEGVGLDHQHRARNRPDCPPYTRGQSSPRRRP